MDIELTLAQVNFARLNEDVRAAFVGRISGIDYDYVRKVAIVHVIGELTAEELVILEGIIATHDPDALTDDQLAAAKIEATLAEADTQSAAIPGWATWTEQQALDYITANVTDLASAKVVLLAMARMLVALRNKTWPGLQA